VSRTTATNKRVAISNDSTRRSGVASSPIVRSPRRPGRNPFGGGEEERRRGTRNRRRGRPWRCTTRRTVPAGADQSRAAAPIHVVATSEVQLLEIVGRESISARRKDGHGRRSEPSGQPP
jgi:hypothetical protein